MVPKPRNSLLGHTVGTEPGAVAIEDGELVFGHDVVGRVHLNAVPNLAESPFEDHVDG